MKKKIPIPRNPVVLVILDGFGFSKNSTNNAIALANTPHLDSLFSKWSNTLIHTSGQYVGLPDGQMGNSEVGHITLGCGSIIRQDLVKIDSAIESGEFFSNPVLMSAVSKAKQRNRPLHLFGLVSDGGVHSHIRHLLALIDLCKQNEVCPALHVITDGRDTPPRSAIRYVEQISKSLNLANGYIASISGRYYAMDRDKRWDRTEAAWRAIALAEGNQEDSIIEAIENSYANDVSDEFILPTVLPGHHPLTAEDQIICFNFRKDRPRQIVEALSLYNFHNFGREKATLPEMTCLMPYNKDYGLNYAFDPEKPVITLGQALSELGIKQFRCAETEKYAHVTYFFNGGHPTPYKGESQQLIPSPSVATYDLDPGMSAEKVCDAVMSAIESEQYGFIAVNFANGDMVGHTGKLDAAIKAVEVLDEQVGRLFHTARLHHYSVLLTADHGNCENMTDEATGVAHTQHTTNPVPCLIMDEEYWGLADNAGLSNIAPTLLQLMGIEKPATMTSDSMLLKSTGKVEEYHSLYGAA